MERGFFAGALVLGLAAGVAGSAASSWAGCFASAAPVALSSAAATAIFGAGAASTGAGGAAGCGAGAATATGVAAAAAAGADLEEKCTTSPITAARAVTEPRAAPSSRRDDLFAEPFAPSIWV